METELLTTESLTYRRISRSLWWQYTLLRCVLSTVLINCHVLQVQGDKEKLLYELDTLQAELEKCNMSSSRSVRQLKLRNQKYILFSHISGCRKRRRTPMRILTEGGRNMKSSRLVLLWLGDCCPLSCKYTASVPYFATLSFLSSLLSSLNWDKWCCCTTQWLISVQAVTVTTGHSQSPHTFFVSSTIDEVGLLYCGLLWAGLAWCDQVFYQLTTELMVVRAQDIKVANYWLTKLSRHDPFSGSSCVD